MKTAVVISALALFSTTTSASAELPSVSSMEPGALGLGNVGFRGGLMATADGPLGAIGFEAMAGLGRIDVGAGVGYTPDLSSCDGESCFGFKVVSVSAQALVVSRRSVRISVRAVGQKLISGESDEDFLFTGLIRVSRGVGGGATRLFVDAMFLVLDDDRGPAGQFGVLYSPNRLGVFATAGGLISDNDEPLPMFSLGLLARIE